VLHDEMRGVDVAADLQDVDDILMPELDPHFGFVEEVPPDVRLLGRLREEDFHREVPVRGRLDDLKDLRHLPGLEEGPELVAADRFIDFGHWPSSREKKRGRPGPPRSCYLERPCPAAHATGRPAN